MFRLQQQHRTSNGELAPARRVSRSRWAALGAAVAVTVGAGSIGVVGATIDSGERPVLVQIEPCRLVDTRPAAPIGPRITPIGTGETYTVSATGLNGNCDLPSEAIGLSLNVTAVQATEQTNVRIFPDANSVPLASNLNPSPSSPPVPNAVTTQLDGAGAFSIFNEFGSVGIIIDVNGYYEDHNHDDRYVQQTDTLWAVVNTNGSLARNSEGVASAERLDATLASGDYAVVFDRDISQCAYQATVGRPGVNSGPQPGLAQVANWGDDPDNGVIVFTKDQNGVGTETRGFHLLVTC